MRSLFIQLSLLTSAMTAVNLIDAGHAPFLSVMGGLLAGCTVCFVLLLGDFTVHRLLEDRVDALKSVQFGQEAPELDWLEESLVAEEPTTPQEALAA